MIKNLLIGLILFFLFYFEPIDFVGIKFAILWKIPLFFFLSFNSFKVVRGFKFSFYSFMYAFKFFFNSGFLFFGYIMDSFLMLLRNLTIPIFFNFSFFNLDEKKLYSVIVFISNFVIFSTIPFLLNIVRPISSGYSLDDYGLSIEGFVGIFQNPHGASVVLTQVLLFKLFQLLNIPKKSYFNLFLFLLGVYVLYNTFVRTSYVMFLIGVFILLLFKYWNRNKLFFLFVNIFFILSILIVYNNSKILQARFNQNYVNSDTELTLDKFSSGRLNLSTVNLENFINSNFLYQAIGLGPSYSMDLMEKDIGLRKNSHNGFVDALVQSGYIGFILFILLLFYVFKSLLIWKSFYSPLGISSFFSFLVFQLFQGGNFFLYEVLLIFIIHLSINRYGKRSI